MFTLAPCKRAKEGVRPEQGLRDHGRETAFHLDRPEPGESGELLREARCGVVVKAGDVASLSGASGLILS